MEIGEINEVDDTMDTLFNRASMFVAVTATGMASG